MMPTCYQLIGVPGAGKSTWVNAQNWAIECDYISTDKFVDAQAELEGKTYNDVFKGVMPIAVKMMAQEVVTSREVGKDIIWDQTSTTVKSRKKKFNMLPNYEHIAVVFNTPDSTELARRLGNRPGKNIPTEIVQDMINKFEMPTLAEGFKEIWYAG